MKYHNVHQFDQHRTESLFLSEFCGTFAILRPYLYPLADIRQVLKLTNDLEGLMQTNMWWSGPFTSYIAGCSEEWLWITFTLFSADGDINLIIYQHLPKSCTGCQMSDALELWPHLAANPILLSIGHIRRVQIPVLLCSNCRTANYPDMICHGVFPIHNKCLISIDYILDLKGVLVSGIHYLQSK